MDLFDAINNRLSYRGKFVYTPVPREDLVKIIRAGLSAPSGCNKQTTDIIGIDDPAVMKSIISVIDPPVGETAPAAICVLTRPIIAYRDRTFCVQDYSAAIENMLLAITAMGYASCWYEGHVTDADRIGRKIADILGVPHEYELVCFMPLGVPASTSRRAEKRPFTERAWINGYKKESIDQ